MVVGVVFDEDGGRFVSRCGRAVRRVTTLITVVSRLQECFLLNRVFVIADRGMVSAKTIATLEA